MRQFDRHGGDASASPREIIDTLLSLAGGGSTEISRSGMEVLASLGIPVAKKNQAGAICLGTAVACCAEMGARDGRVEEWLSILEEMKTSLSAWCLGALAEWPMPDAFRGKARAGASRLAAAGVKAAPPSVPGRHSHTVLTACDGMGSRSVAFFRETPGHGLDAMNILLNDLAGIKDATYFPETGTDLEALYRNDPGISCAFVEPSFAGEFVADALARHAARRTSPPWRLFPALPYAGGCGISPAARTPDLGAYSLDSILRTPELLEDRSLLMNSPLYGCFTPDTDEAYRFCGKFAAMRGTALPPAEFERFVREVAVKDRENLLRRMALNLEFASLAGCSHRRENTQAARTWLAIRDGIIPFWKIPYVRELSRMAVEMALENIRHGYFSRGQAFGAAQQMGAEYFESAYALMDEHGWLNVPPDERIALVDDFMNALEAGTPMRTTQVNRSAGKSKRKPKRRSGKNRRRR